MNAIDSFPAPPAIVARPVTVAAPDAPIMGYFAAPKSAWRSAVVVVGHDAKVDEHAMEIARGLARAGHGALAIGAEAPPPHGATFARLAARVDAALARLRAEAPSPPARFGVVGYGAGGLSAVVAGYRCRVGAAVSFYGEGPMRLRADLTRIIDQPKRHSAPFLFLLGGEDTSVRPPDVAAIRERLDAFGMRSTFIIYPRTRGAFCHPDGRDYRPADAGDAWNRLLHALDTAPRLRHRFPPKAAPVPRKAGSRATARSPVARPR